MKKTTWKKGVSMALAAAMMSGNIYLPAVSSLTNTAIVKAAQEEQMPESPTVVDGMVYATVNMEYEDFYYGELNSITDVAAENMDLSKDIVDQVYSDNQYDAVTSATTSKSVRFGTTYFDTDVTNDEKSDGTGVNINGVKDVQIAIPEALYKKLYDNYKNVNGTNKNHQVYAYLKNASYSETAFTEYKELNGDGTFKAMVTEKADSSDITASITSTSAWGDYQISISNLPDTVITSGDTANVLGVVLTDSDGKKYGMLAEDNLWFKAGEISFAVKEFSEPHGNHVSYAHTADLNGKTIKNITYLLKNAEDISINTDLFCKTQLESSQSITSEAGNYTANGAAVKFTFHNVSDDYKVSTITKGSGREAQTLDQASYSYDETAKILTLNASCKAGDDYYATFTSDQYADVKVSFAVNKADQTISGTDAYIKVYGDGAFNLDAKATEGTLTYHSSDSNIATVDVNGKVTIKGVGTAEIIVKTEGGDNYNATQKTVKITVVKKVSTITCATSFTKAYGSKAFNLGIKSNGAAVKYVSGNTKIATVSSNGTVSIKGTGIVTITVTAGDSNYTAVTKKITIKVTPKKQSVKIKAGKKKATVQWKKDTKATGYSIQIGTKKNFKGAKTYTVKTYKTYKKVIKKLKSKKKYYVRVRAYKTSGKTKLYGAYSTAKSVKVK